MKIVCGKCGQEFEDWDLAVDHLEDDHGLFDQVVNEYLTRI